MFSRKLILQKNVRFGLLRKYCQSSEEPPQIVRKSKPIVGQINTNIPGLSTNVLKECNTPVGPGASKTGEYKVPEYFLFNRESYHEAEIEMAKYRGPQPSSIKLE